jgi:hypothetical protein
MNDPILQGQENLFDLASYLAVLSKVFMTSSYAIISILGLLLL